VAGSGGGARRPAAVKNRRHRGAVPAVDIGACLYNARMRRWIQSSSLTSSPTLRFPAQEPRSAC